jgi:hypothetical protein
MVARGLISEFERSLSSQEGPVWIPAGGPVPYLRRRHCQVFVSVAAIKAVWKMAQIRHILASNP